MNKKKQIIFFMFLILIITANNVLKAANIKHVNNNKYIEQNFLNLEENDNGNDSIFLKSGTIIVCKVLEVTTNEIKFQRTENGTIMTIKSKNVTKIIYSDGKTNNLSFYSPDTIYLERTFDTFASLSLFTGIVGFFIASIILGPLAIIFGFTGIVRIYKYKYQYRGKGLAILGILIGLLDFIIILSMI